MQGHSLSSSLSYLISLISSIGVNPLPCHHLLRAAANDPSTTAPVISLLWDIVVFHLAFPLLPNTHTQSQSTPADKHEIGEIDLDTEVQHERISHGRTHSRDISQAPLTLDSLDVTPNVNICQEEKLCFVKYYLAIWGYAPTSPFFTLNHETSQSRHLLLALGWLISHCNVFSRAIERRISVIMGKAPVITSSYLDTLAMDKGGVAMKEAREYVGKVLAASQSLDESRAKVKAKGEQLLMLCGHVRMTLRSLYALLSCKAKRTHELNQIQLGENVMGLEGHPFSPFELHLLEHRKTLEEYLLTLEMIKDVTKELDECNQHESTFWQWMGEVARQQLSQKHDSLVEQHLTSTSGVCTTHLLPILTYFRSELERHSSTRRPSHVPTTTSKSDGSSNAAIGSQANLTSPPDMTKWQIMQEGDVKAKTMSNFGADNQTMNMFNSLQRHLLPQEATGKSQNIQCLDEKHFERYTLSGGELILIESLKLGWWWILSLLFGVCVERCGRGEGFSYREL